jgi:excisionase family DNA binding protein
MVSGTTGSAKGMMDVRAVADLCNCSVRHVERLIATGRIPRPVRIGRLRRFNRAAIEAWIAAGCPAPEKMRAKKEAAHV